MFIDLAIKAKNKDFSYSFLKQTHTKMIIGKQQQGEGREETLQFGCLIIWSFHAKLWQPPTRST